MPLRRATAEELMAAVRELGRCQAQYEYIKFGRKWYGPTAVRLHIHTDSEYDDQGGYDDYVSGVDAYDMLGHELPLDPKAAGVDTSEVDEQVKKWVRDYGYTEEVLLDVMVRQYMYDDLRSLDAGFVNNYGYEVHIPPSTEDPVLSPIYVEETFDGSTIFRPER